MSFLTSRDRFGTPRWVRLADQGTSSFKDFSLRTLGKSVGYGISALYSNMPPYSHRKRRRTDVSVYTPPRTPSTYVRGRSTTGASRPRAVKIKINASTQTKRYRRGRTAQRVRNRSGLPRGGKFKRTKRVSRKSMKFTGLNAVTSVVEGRGNITDPHACYVGHAMAPEAVVRSTMRMLVKMLYQKHGWEIASFSEELPFNATDEHFMQLEYYTTRESTSRSLVDSAAYGSASTFEDVANALLAVFQPLASSQIYYLSLTLFDGAPFGEVVMLSKLQLSRLNINFEFKSDLKVQNITSAGLGTEAEDELINNVDSNPLIGRLYETNKWMSGFDIHWRPGASSTSWTGFTGRYDSGIISTNAAAVDNTETQDFRKPPPPFAFNATKAVGVRLEPGEIQTSKIYFKTRLMFNTLMNKTYPAYASLVAGARKFFPFGKAKMVGLEKLLDAGAAVDASLVHLGFEVVSTISIQGNQIKAGTLPVVSVLPQPAP